MVNNYLILRSASYYKKNLDISDSIKRRLLRKTESRYVNQITKYRKPISRHVSDRCHCDFVLFCSVIFVYSVWWDFVATKKWAEQDG